jgi:nucleotide-binding universal stress UspA family protein
MNIKSILAVTDLSAREDIAIRRASQLAATHRATLKLMYLAAHGQPTHPDPAARLAKTACEIEERLGLRVGPVAVKTHELDDVVAEARGMDMLVLPHRHERSTAAFFGGQPVLRLLRRCCCPVLVVRKLRREHYSRVLVAVDLSPRSKPLVDLAGKLDPLAEMEIFNAIGTLDEAKLRSAEAPEHVVLAFRERCLRRAQRAVISLSASFDARRKHVLTLVGRGDPGRRTVIQQEHSGADLVVLGKKRSSVWEDFFRGSVAHRVLSWGSSDVLVVPQAFLEATAPVPARRVRKPGDQPAVRKRSPARRSS